MRNRRHGRRSGLQPPVTPERTHGYQPVSGDRRIRERLGEGSPRGHGDGFARPSLQGSGGVLRGAALPAAQPPARVGRPGRGGPSDPAAAVPGKRTPNPDPPFRWRGGERQRPGLLSPRGLGGPSCRCFLSYYLKTKFHRLKPKELEISEYPFLSPN